MKDRRKKHSGCQGVNQADGVFKDYCLSFAHLCTSYADDSLVTNNIRHLHDQSRGGNPFTISTKLH